MLGLTSVQVDHFIFNITEENKKFDFYKFLESIIEGISYEKVRDEVEKDLKNSDTTAIDLQDGIIGPKILKEYRKEVSKRMKNDNYLDILAHYTSSMSQDFESYLSLVWLKMTLDWF